MRVRRSYAVLGWIMVADPQHGKVSMAATEFAPRVIGARRPSPLSEA